MEVAAGPAVIAQEAQRFTKHGVHGRRRDYMDLDEFLMVATNFEGSKKNVITDNQANMNYPPQAFPGSIYSSIFNHITSSENFRNIGYHSDRRKNGHDVTSGRSPRPRDRADLYQSDESSNDSQDGCDSQRGDRVSQAVSVIVSDSKDQDGCESSGDSIDSGFGTKANSVIEDDAFRCDGGGKSSKSRRRRKNEYVYNPLPVGRKSTRKFVPTDKKDDRYWEQRIKNNIAAKRSREARRQKEMEILNRCQALVDENDSLKESNERLQCKIEELERRLELYDKMVSNDNVLLVKV